MPSDAAIAVHLWHFVLTGLGTLATILSILGAYWRMSVIPEKQRRAGVEARLNEVEKKQALQEQRLESGNKRFDEILGSIEKLRQELKADHTLLEGRMRSIEQAVAASVWRGVNGVGEQR